MFFRGDFNGTPPQRRSHTHTHTNTHTHDGPPVDARSSGSSFFSGFANLIFDPVRSAIFRPPGGHAIYENIILKEKLFLFIYVSIF